MCILELVYANCAFETEYNLYKWYLISAWAVFHHHVMKTACFIVKSSTHTRCAKVVFLSELYETAASVSLCLRVLGF